MFDPFLLIDEMGPVDYAPGRAVGAPDHPHRGFETVTYILEGGGEHEDSAGHRGTIGPGAVQWMTAGRGIVHSETPSRHLLDEGGRMHGFQVWVNLPARLKMTEPRYQELSAESIPRATSADGLARATIIAGSALGAAAAIDTHTPITYVDWTLEPGAKVTTETPAAQNFGLYVFRGALTVGPEGKTVSDGEFAMLGEGDSLELAVPADATEPARALLLGGVPIGEPVARYGPFVMNTEAELQQAFADYRAGRMGRIQRTAVARY